MRPKKPPSIAQRSNDEVRRCMLEYFHRRNANATSAKGKKGSAVKISDVKADLKAWNALTQQQVQSNLTYLISQGWVEEKAVSKEIRGRGGTLIPSVTSFYQITAAGIDKIEGSGEFTMPKFHGIKIEATGQNVITLGDGNQVNAKFGDAGRALADLRDAVVRSDAPEDQKMAVVADIDTIQSQLAKPEPNPGILAAAWDAVRVAAAVHGCAGLVQSAGALLRPLLPH